MDLDVDSSHGSIETPTTIEGDSDHAHEEPAETGNKVGMSASYSCNGRPACSSCGGSTGGCGVEF